MSEETPVGDENEAGEICPECSGKSRTRSDEEMTRLTHRLNRIEGQVKGVKAMLLSDAYCTDILVQVQAVRSALGSFAKELLSQHIRTCVADGIKEGRDDVVDELVAVVGRLIK